jgi:hypothetical protein
MMSGELATVMSAVPESATRADYAAAIIEADCLDKPTASTRRLTNQRLSELYGLDPAIPIFRVLRRLWSADEKGRPLLALLVAIARDPLLAASAAPVVSLRPGEEYRKDPVTESIRTAVQERLGQATLDKVVRNVSSSWAQSGHLEGRTFKRRVQVVPTVGSTTMALYLGWLCGHRGEELLDSAWTRLLDATRVQTVDLALSAKRLGLIDLNLSDRIVDLSFRRLDPAGSVR